MSKTSKKMWGVLSIAPVVIMAGLSGCKSPCPVPYAPNTAAVLPERPDIKPIDLKKYPKPTINFIFDYNMQGKFIETSDDKYHLEGLTSGVSSKSKAKVAIINPFLTDINARIATDILYMNLIKNGISVLDRETIDSIVKENEMIEDKKVIMSKASRDAILNRIKHAKYAFVLTVGNVKTRKVMVNNGIWFAKFNQKAYDKDVDSMNKIIAGYNNKLYSIIKKRLLDDNERIRLHNFAVLYNAMDDSDFAEQVEKLLNKKQIKYKDLSPKEKVKLLLGDPLRQSHLPWVFDRKYPSHYDLLGISQAMRDAKDAKKQIADINDSSSKTNGVANLDSEDNERIANAKFKIQQSRISIRDFRQQDVDGIKQCILEETARKKYGIVDKTGDLENMVIPAVVQYNKLVKKYNSMLELASLRDRLKPAFSVPPLIPLIKKEDLTKSYKGKNIYTQVEVGLSLRVLDTSSSEILWIVTGNRIRQNYNEAMNEICKDIVKQIANKK